MFNCKTFVNKACSTANIYCPKIDLINMRLPSAVWRSLWLFKVPFDLNFFPHISQRCVFSVLWRFMWAFKLLLLRVAYSQREHLKGLTPKHEKLYHETSRLCLSMRSWTFAWKKFHIMWATWTKRNTSKFGSLQIKKFIYTFCGNDAELMTASLNLLRERRSSFRIEYCPTEARYWV